MSDNPVTSVEDIPWGDPPTARVATSTPRPCKHPRSHRFRSPDGQQVCLRCDHVFDPVVLRRNRNNRKRGNDIERRVCADLGVTPRGRFGDPVDGGSDADPYLVQVKSGGYYKPQQAAILDAMAPQRRDRVAVLVTVETPGPGRSARRLVTLTYEDWQRIAEELWPESNRGMPNVTPVASPAASADTSRT